MKIEHLQIDEVNCFNNDHGNGVIISWSANIGFGELTLYHKKVEDKWKVDTECMGKEFARMVLNKWIDEMEIEE